MRSTKYAARRYRPAGQRAEVELHLPAKKVGERWRLAPIGYMDHVDAGHHLEQLAGEMWNAPVADRRHVDLARIDPSVGDELGDRLGRNWWIRLHDERDAVDACEGRNVANEIEIEMVIQRRVGRVNRGNKE